MTKAIAPIAAMAALLACRCASYQTPNEHLANTYANIRTAQALGAEASPQAALHLKLAQEEQARAKALVADDKNEEADFMTQRANSDAELAVAIARHASAAGRTAAQEAQADRAGRVTAATLAAPATFSATTTTTTGAVVPSTETTK